MKSNKLVLISLLSITLISLEIVWTRIFSAEFYYTFAFLILSLAILGMGLGALTLRLVSFLNQEKRLSLLLSLTAFFALIGPPVVLHIGLDFSKLLTSWMMVIKFVFTILLLSSSFFTGGIALALLFKIYHKDMPKLYMADLLGAGGGVALAVFLMNGVGTPVATTLICLPIIVAAFLCSRNWQKIVPVALTIGVVCFSFFANTVLDKPREERAPVIYKHWDAMAKIKIFNFDEQYHGINIDNLANSPVFKFDGNWDRPDSMRYEFGINVKYLIERADSCTFLSLGAGGGGDVLQALQEGATEVHAVEVNSLINNLMLEGDLAEFSGHIYNDPRVKVVTEDARAYVRRFHNKFDLIYSLSSNTFAALASGSFALAENYLFTTEAYKDYYQSLSPNGFMMMEHQFYMPRIASEVLDALTDLGIKDPQSHIAIYDLPRMRRNMLLLSKAPLTEEIRQNAFGELTPEKYEDIHLLYPAADSISGNLINRIVLNGWKTEADSSLIDISPCTDNRPFTAQLGLWRNLKWDQLKELKPFEFKGFPLSKLLVTIILLIIFFLILPLNLLPYFIKGEKLRAIPWLYFFVIGMAFMIVEVVLIQKYTLFIGPSSYTFMTILLTLLVGSGIGSRFSPKVKDYVPFVGIIVWILLEIVVLNQVKYALGGITMIPRIFVSMLFILPLAFFMGMPFPKATKRVGELVDWGFAVNGAASVLGSTAIIIVSFSFGFNVALACGAGLYFLALVFIQAEKRW